MRRSNCIKLIVSQQTSKTTHLTKRLYITKKSNVLYVCGKHYLITVNVQYRLHSICFTQCANVNSRWTYVCSNETQF